MSISILVSGAGIVSLGGTADASKLATGDPNKARKALDGSIRRLAGWGSIGTGWWYCGKNKYIRYMRTRYISYMTSTPVKMTGMILKTQSVNFNTSFWRGYCFAGRDGGCF